MGPTRSHALFSAVLVTDVVVSWHDGYRRACPFCCEDVHADKCARRSSVECRYGEGLDGGILNTGGRRLLFTLLHASEDCAFDISSTQQGTLHGRG